MVQAGRVEARRGSCGVLQALTRRVCYVQHGAPAGECILVKSPCLLWKTLTLIGALRPWSDESLRILQMLVGDVRSVQHGPPAKESILVKLHFLCG